MLPPNTGIPDHFPQDHKRATQTFVAAPAALPPQCRVRMCLSPHAMCNQASALALQACIYTIGSLLSDNLCHVLHSPIRRAARTRAVGLLESLARTSEAMLVARAQIPVLGTGLPTAYPAAPRVNVVD